MRKIILASASPRRRQLLKQLGLQFEVIPSDLEEKFNPRLGPRNQVELLAKQKAEAVASKFENAIIIAADTLVVLGNEIIGKPKDKNEAKRMLKKLRGREHSVVTGFVLIDTATSRMIIKSVETRVWFKKFSISEMHAYIKTGEPFDKAGGYGNMGLGTLFVEKIEGDYSGSIGLPLFILGKELRKLGVEIL